MIPFIGVLQFLLILYIAGYKGMLAILPNHIYYTELDYKKLVRMPFYNIDCSIISRLVIRTI